jgi:hypothetical protein
MLVLEQLWLRLAGLVPLSEPKYMVQPIGLDREMQRQPHLYRSAGDPTLRSGNAEYADCGARGGTTIRREIVILEILRQTFPTHYANGKRLLARRKNGHHETNEN